jgi:hypothetical protein
LRGELIATVGFTWSLVTVGAAGGFGLPQSPLPGA